MNYRPHFQTTKFVFIITITLDAGLLARSQYPEGPMTGHLDTGFFLVSLCLQTNAEMVPSFQVATTCLSGSPPDLNFLVTFFSIFVYMYNNHCHRAITQLQFIIIIIIDTIDTSISSIRMPQ